MLKAKDKNRLDVREMKCLRTMSGVTKWDRIPNDEIRGRTGVESKLSYRAEQGGLRWYGHMERMDDGRMTKRVMKSEAEGTRPRGRPKLEWEDGVASSLSARGLSLEEGREIALNRGEWRKVVKS